MLTLRWLESSRSEASHAPEHLRTEGGEPIHRRPNA